LDELNNKKSNSKKTEQNKDRKSFCSDIRCIPCVTKQAIDSLNRRSDISEKDRWHAMSKIINALRETNLTNEESIYRKSPAYLCGLAIRTVSQNNDQEEDHYVYQKNYWNEKTLEIYSELKEMIYKEDEKLLTAVKLSIIGNIIDFGVGSLIKKIDKNINSGSVEEELIHIVKDILKKGNFKIFDWEDFCSSVKDSKRIVFIADNCGEIVFDRLLIEMIGPGRITLIVRKKPMLNDVTIKEAINIFSDISISNIIDDGNYTPMPGFSFDYASEESINLIKSADLVISKGMGNFESLINESDERYYFLMVSKCDVVSEYLGVGLNSLIMLRGGNIKNE